MIKKIWLAAGIVIVAAVSIAVVSYLAQPAIPRKYLKQAGFGVWYPPKGSSNIFDKKSVKYTQSGQDKLITFSATSPNNTLYFTEQAEPESFVDVPQVYQKLTEKLHAYSNFNGVNGTVYITQPEELHGGQTVVMDAKGTLVFIRPQSSLSTAEWRTLTDSLEFVH